MLDLKLHKRLCVFTLLVSLISFSGFTNTIPVDVKKTTIEVVHVITSNRHKCYNYEDGLFGKQKSSKQYFRRYDFNCFLSHKQCLQVLNYNNFTEKHIALGQIKLFLKTLYFTSYIDSPAKA